MSGVVVLIGYILVIPSILGILVGVIGIVSSGSAGTISKQASQKRAESGLLAANVPVTVIAKLKDDRNALAVSDTARLTGTQRAAIRSASLTLAASNAGTAIGVGIAAGFSIFVVVASLVGGLLGYLLIMKKSVLQCDNCGATLATG
jgi:hypothetical protein